MKQLYYVSSATMMVVLLFETATFHDSDTNVSTVLSCRRLSVKEQFLASNRFYTFLGSSWPYGTHFRICGMYVAWLNTISVT